MVRHAPGVRRTGRGIRGTRPAVIALLALGALAGGTVYPLGAAQASPRVQKGFVLAPAFQAQVRSYLQVETSDPVVNVLYKYGSLHPAANGAYGSNVTAPPTAWFVEEQRAGATDVIDGVLRQDPALIAEGLRMFHYGLARQAPNGSFPGSAWPFHGTALFLSEAAPALVVLGASPLAARFGGEMQWEIGRMQRAAYYMVRSAGGPGSIDDHTKNHRYFEAAIALGAVSILANDTTLRDWSALYASQGIRMQRPNGIMPEDRGHDSGYQAVGMVHAIRYLELVAHGSLRGALQRALQRGEAWEMSRVGPDGSINQMGDTRTAGCRERNPQGQCKTVFYAPVFSAFAHWAAVAGSPVYQQASYMVWLKSGYGAR
jgi:hypothetical protein